MSDPVTIVFQEPHFLELIFFHLDQATLRKVESVCRLWKSVAGRNVLWKSFCKSDFPGPFEFASTQKIAVWKDFYNKQALRNRKVQAGKLPLVRTEPVVFVPDEIIASNGYFETHIKTCSLLTQNGYLYQGLIGGVMSYKVGQGVDFLAIGSTNTVMTLLYAADHLFVGCGDGSIYVRDTTSKNIYRLYAPNRWQFAVDILSVADSLLYSIGHWGDSVGIWDWQEKKLLHVLQFADSRALSCAAIGKQLFISDATWQKIQVWEGREGSWLTSWKCEEHLAEELTFADASLLSYSWCRHAIILWDTTKGEATHKFALDALSANFRRFRMLAWEGLLFAGMPDGKIYVLDLIARKRIGVLADIDSCELLRVDAAGLVIRKTHAITVPLLHYFDV